LTMSGDKVYSNRLNQGLIDFLDARFGKPMTDEVLSRINLDRLTVSDPSGFATAEVTHALTMAAMEVTGEKRITYLIARDLPKSLGMVGGFILGITSPQIFMKTLGQIEGRMALKTINKTTKVGRNRWRVDITFKDGFQDEYYVCENRIGCYEVGPLFFGLPYAKVEHPQCFHRREGHCVYYIDFPEYGFLWYKRAAQFLFAAVLIASGISMNADFRHLFPALPGALMIAGLLCFSYYKHLGSKKSLEWSLMLNEGLTRQNQRLEKMISKVEVLQSLTTALVESADAREACSALVHGLVHRMRFGSSQIWLLDGEGNLACVAAEGYSPATMDIIKAAKFKLGEEWDNPHGLLVQTLENRKTIIVNEMEDILPRVTAKTRDFLTALKLSSFIMTPLFHADTPLGILAGENHQGEKIESQDQLIFQSLAHVLSATIVKSGPMLRDNPSG
jgi:hypothetical protein